MANDPNDDDFDADSLEIKSAGPEEMAALLKGFQDNKVVFAPEAEIEMKEAGLTVDDLITMISAGIKKNLN